MKYDGRLYTQAEVDAMNNTPKTVAEILTRLENAVAYDVTKRVLNHQSGRSPKSSHLEAITALNELIRNERIDELNKLMDYTDENEIVCVCEQANVEVCDHNWSLCHTAREHIAELRAEERLQK